MDQFHLIADQNVFLHYKKYNVEEIGRNFALKNGWDVPTELELAGKKKRQERT